MSLPTSRASLAIAGMVSLPYRDDLAYELLAQATHKLPAGATVAQTSS